MPTRRPLVSILVTTALVLATAWPIAPASAAPPAEAAEPSEPPPTSSDSAAPSEAAPQPAIERVDAVGDEVVLRDGSFARGSVVELSTGSHVTVDVAGETRRYEWAQIERIRLGRSEVEAAPKPTPAPASPTASPAGENPLPHRSDAGGTRVHMHAEDEVDVTLYRVTGEFAASGSGGSMSGVTYEPVCEGKCGARVDGSSGHEYFVGGAGITPSKPFSLSGRAADVHLDVRAGSKPARIAGILFTSLGASFAISGLVLVAIGKDNRAMRRAGIGFAVPGGVMLVVGLPLALMGRTLVERR